VDSHWRNTMRTARFFTFDARAGAVVFLLILHPRLYTVYFAVFCLLLFYLLERLGLPFPAALRKVRAWLCGVERPAHIASSRRRLIDYNIDT